MTKKYFTPDIEDIRIGYECEYKIETWKSPDHPNMESSNKEDATFKLKRKSWFPWTFSTIKDTVDITKYRTPYLTTEQIKAQGWEHTKNKYVLKYKHYKFTGLGFFPENKIRISNENSKFLSKSLTIFYGKCRCINEFRYICKLLNIK